MLTKKSASELTQAEDYSCFSQQGDLDSDCDSDISRLFQGLTLRFNSAMYGQIPRDAIAKVATRCGARLFKASRDRNALEGLRVVDILEDPPSSKEGGGGTQVYDSA
jgi:hypothetical protein